MTTITISSGHGAKVQGAVGILNEVDEARRVVDALAIELEERGVEVHTYHDNTSDSQSENLSAICDWHNSIECDLAISIHFNAYEPCEQGRGVEMLYVTQQALATEMSAAVASCGLINRGAKKRTDLKFLNSTEAPAILAEICFVDSETDCEVALVTESNRVESTRKPVFIIVMGFGVVINQRFNTNETKIKIR